LRICSSLRSRARPSGRCGLQPRGDTVISRKRRRLEPKEPRSNSFTLAWRWTNPLG
jgi:hypothetical protein